MTWEIGLGIVAIAASVAGQVVSYNQQQKAASQAQAMADYNYALQKQQAEVQSQLLQRQSEQNANLMEYQAAIQNRNAEILKAQATAVQNQYQIASEAAAKTGVRNVQAERENARRFLALTRAKIGESGTTGAGSPIEALADAADTLELHAQEVWQGANIEARKLTDAGNATAYQLRQESQNEGFKAGMTLFQAANERWAGRTAEVQKRLSIYGAEAERLEGYSTARGYRMASYGTLFSGIAQTAGSGYSLYRTSSTGNSSTYGGYGAAGGTMPAGGNSIGKSPFGYS